MVRTLPWLTSTSATTTKSNSTTSKATDTSSASLKNARKRSPSPTSSRKSSPWRTSPKTSRNSTATRTTRTKTDVHRGRLSGLTDPAYNRTPSTSPPPPLPSFQVMRSDVHGGPSPDAAWMMVEDEFLSTAQAFTQHLHHAEYKRLQKVVQRKSEAGGDAILRPVDWRVPRGNQVDVKIRSREMASRVQGAFAQNDGRETEVVEAQEEDEIIIDDKHLADLMLRNGNAGDKAGGQRQRLNLTTGTKGIKSATRAAAGFGKQEVAAVEKTYDLPGFRRRVQHATNTDIRAGGSDDDDDLENTLIPSSAIKLDSPRHNGLAVPEVSRLPSLAELRTVKQEKLERIAPKERSYSVPLGHETKPRHAVDKDKRSGINRGLNLGASLLSQDPSKSTTAMPADLRTTGTNSTSSSLPSKTRQSGLPPPARLIPKAPNEPFVDVMMPKPRSAALLGLSRPRTQKEDARIQGFALTRVKKEENDEARRRSVKLEEIPTFLF